MGRQPGKMTAPNSTGLVYAFNASNTRSGVNGMW